MTIIIFTPICHHFRDIRGENVHDRNLDLQNGPMSDVNMLIESTFATSCLLAVVLVTVFKDIRSRNLHDLDIDLSYGPRSDVSMPIESRYQTFYFLIVGPICHCETITYAFDSKFDFEN